MKISIPLGWPTGRRRLFLSLAAVAGVAASSAAGYRAAWRDPAAAALSWKVRVARVEHAPATTGGLVLRVPGKAETALAEGTEIPAGGEIVTDSHTRALLQGIDGTQIALDTSSDLVIEAGPRTMRLAKGIVLADVAHIDAAPPAHITTPQGDVTVLGTKLAVTAEEDRTHVEVLRGVVSLARPGSAATEVLAGQEAVASAAGIDLAPASDLAQRVAFGERFGVQESHNDDADAPAGGLGELRARKPGQEAEKDHALRLARHAIKVRIASGMARTEIDETFANDSDDVLEGVYRFPLPAGAQIERLALEVDDKLVDGAFVDRSKGQAIWRGAIQNATPTAPKPREEIFWVPGPWRDPALLEWQRGGRFELKIFPIPKRSSRRVVIAYTETLQPVAGRRRYVYPLPSDAKLTVDDLFIDAQVLGNDPEVPVQVRGYELDSTKVDGGIRLSRDLGKSVPAGDLTIEYALPDAKSQMSAWSFAEAPADAKTAGDKYALIALRPKLPTWGDGKPRDYVVVVDTGRSMFGERFKRASRLAVQITEEMDRRDRVTVLACDLTCKRMPGGMKPAGSPTAHDVDAFLAGVTIDGASDLAGAVREAAALADPARDSRVVLLSDGVASAGYRAPSHLSSEVASVSDARTSVVTVPIGSDADTNALGEIARGGGGAVVPYAPGEPLEAAALEVLAATYGKTLRDVRVSLPTGLEQAAPQSLPPVRAGSEVLVAAKMTSDHVAGDVVVSGTLAGEPFEAKFPLDLSSTNAAGNSFVPRTYASLRIADKEREPGDGSKAELVALSQKYSVPSKYTSLLVLESEAMFHAFGIEHAQRETGWTGESLAVGGVVETAGTLAPGGDEEKNKDDLSGLLSSGSGFGRGMGISGGGGAPSADSTVAEAKPAARKAAMAPAPTATTAPAHQAPPPNIGPWNDFGRRGQWMKRVWHREAMIAAQTDDVVPLEKIADARAKLAASPDERQRTIDLVRVLQRSDTDRDQQDLARVLDDWQKRDPLDDAAIGARADMAAMQGDRDESIRIRSGIAAALRTPDPAVLDALAVAEERSLHPAEACSIRIAASEAKPDDDDRLARAVRCERARGRATSASSLLDGAGTKRSSSLAKVIDAQEAASTKGESVTSGDIVVDASWSDPDADLDIAIVDPSGQRIGWTSSARFAHVVDATARGHEALSLTNNSVGAFEVEITRSVPAKNRGTIHGTVTVKAFGEKKTLPFDLSGASVRVAKIDAHWESELVAVEGDPEGTPFDRGIAAARLSSVSVAHCHDPAGGGSGAVLVTFAPSGRVLSAAVRSPFSPVAVACVSSAFQSLTVPPFSGGPTTVSRGIVVGP